jgi:hypothetical protein
LKKKKCCGGCCRVLFPGKTEKEKDIEMAKRFSYESINTLCKDLEERTGNKI